MEWAHRWASFTQMLADQLTMHEASGKDYSDISRSFVGDARNNVANSLLVSGAMLGMDVRIVGPKTFPGPGHY